MQASTAVQTQPSSAGLGSDLREGLPPLVVGEKPVTHRQHEWPGSLFYSLAYLSAVGLGAGALGYAALALVNLEPRRAGLALLLALGAAVQSRLANEVEHFSRWGWYGAMVELGAAAAAKVWSMAEGNFVGGAIGLCIDLAWMSYFWERRDEFDVDLDL